MVGGGQRTLHQRCAEETGSFRVGVDFSSAVMLIRIKTYIPSFDSSYM